MRSLYSRSIPMADTFTPSHSQSGFLQTQKKPILTTSNLPGMAFLLLPLRKAHMEISKMTLCQHQLAEPAQRWPLRVMVCRKAAPGNPKHRNPWVNMTLSFDILNSSMLFSALKFHSGSGTTKLRTHRKVNKRFSQWHLIFFPQVTRPTCSQQLS